MNILGVANSLFGDAYKIEGRCTIDAFGNIVNGKSANHRFAIAVELGLKSFPLIVEGIHEDLYFEYA